MKVKELKNILRVLPDDAEVEINSIYNEARECKTSPIVDANYKSAYKLLALTPEQVVLPESSMPSESVTIEIEHDNGNRYMAFEIAITNDGIAVIKTEDCDLADEDGDYIFNTDNTLLRIQSNKLVSEREGNESSYNKINSGVSTKFFKGNIIIITENADGEIYCIEADGLNDILKDWQSECTVVPANDAKVFFASVNGIPVNPHFYTDFESLLTCLEIHDKLLKKD